MNYWGTVYRLAWGLLAALVIFGVICLFMPRCRKLQEMHNTRTEIEKKNRVREKKIEEMQEKRRLFETDPEFVKRIARETGRVTTDETVYKEVTNSPDINKLR